MPEHIEDQRLIEEIIELPIESALERMCQLLGCQNKNQLALMLDVNPSTPSKWIGKGEIPTRYIKSSVMLYRDLKESKKTLEKIIVKDSELAEYLSMSPANITIMKKKNPSRYGLLINGMKLQKIGELI